MHGQKIYITYMCKTNNSVQIGMILFKIVTNCVCDKVNGFKYDVVTQKSSEGI